MRPGCAVAEPERQHRVTAELGDYQASNGYVAPMRIQAKRGMAMKLTAIIDAVATVRTHSCPLSLQGHDHDRRVALGRATAAGAAA
jgi:hypothetical protein